jgi:hypothetical protein
MKNTLHASVPHQRKDATWLAWAYDAPNNKFKGSEMYF